MIKRPVHLALDSREIGAPPAAALHSTQHAMAAGEVLSSPAAMEQYLLEVSLHGAPTPDLPSSREGKPKPAPPWIAAALYWVASNPVLQPLTGVSVTEAKLGPPAEPCMFKIVSLGDNGAAIARLLREIMSLAGSGLKLPGWDAVRKHLSPGWWENPTRGGNRGGDFSQTYVERVPFTFAVRPMYTAAATAATTTASSRSSHTPAASCHSCARPSRI